MFDLLVIGGGVNGAGIARDAAGRGLRVMLCEKGDLAEGTSSRSGKLIHGGLRYLEYYEFRLVREALIEREVLLKLAPHIVWPMRFVLPHSAEQRPAWMIRLGLFLYDHLGGRERLPATRRLDLRRDPEGAAIKPDYRTAFEYSDCWVEDARLVVLNALDAAQRGAEVLVRTEVASARREDGAWTVTLRAADGGERQVRARVLANAAGPWVEHVLQGVAGQNSARRVRLVKGSHLIVPKFWDGPQAYLLQNDDKRVIFVNPYEGDLCLIGTTDIPYEGAAEDVAIEDRERDYLLSAVNRYMRRQLGAGDVVNTFSGVRPLYDDASANPSAVTRDYVFDVDGRAANGAEAQPPVLSVFGGKITTYRRLAEHAMDKLGPFYPRLGPAWTGKAALPGGDIPGADFDTWLRGLQARFAFLPPDLAWHYGRLYGTRADALLDGAKSLADLGRHFGGRLYEREADFLRRTEWARAPEDVLQRRTKHYLHMTAAEQDAFAAWMGRA
ncbi:MAG TPA: glycerol-3-phosphate dehydrogenase [Acetobacteraceae bacterium]|nr:glycerol-3-phosphate dehydrogenase [Acetobacteraceae bacterium]